MKNYRGQQIISAENAWLVKVHLVMYIEESLISWEF